MTRRLWPTTNKQTPCELDDIHLPLQDEGTFLLVLDAKTFGELGRANVPVNMAYGFHGAFSAAV